MSRQTGSDNESPLSFLMSFFEQPTKGRNSQQNNMELRLNSGSRSECIAVAGFRDFQDAAWGLRMQSMANCRWPMT